MERPRLRSIQIEFGPSQVNRLGDPQAVTIDQCQRSISHSPCRPTLADASITRLASSGDRYFRQTFGFSLRDPLWRIAANPTASVIEMASDLPIFGKSSEKPNVSRVLVSSKMAEFAASPGALAAV